MALKAYTIWDALFKKHEEKSTPENGSEALERNRADRGPLKLQSPYFEVDAPMPLSVNLCPAKYYFVKSEWSLQVNKFARRWKYIVIKAFVQCLPNYAD